MQDLILLIIQCIQKLCFDGLVCLSISSTGDSKLLKSLYGIVPKGKQNDISTRLFYTHSNKLKRKIFYNSSTWKVFFSFNLFLAYLFCRWYWYCDFFFFTGSFWHQCWFCSVSLSWQSIASAVTLAFHKRFPEKELGLYVHLAAILFASQQYWPVGGSTEVYVCCVRSKWQKCSLR